MSEVDIKLKEVKKNSRTFLLVSTLVIIILTVIYYSVLSKADSPNSNYFKINFLYKLSISIVYILGLLGYLTGAVFNTLSLYRGEKFYGESEFKESRNGDLYTKKRHMFKASLIANIVLISAFLILNVLVSIMIFI